MYTSMKRATDKDVQSSVGDRATAKRSCALTNGAAANDREPAVVTLAIPNFGPAERVNASLQILTTSVANFLDSKFIVRLNESVGVLKPSKFVLELVVVKEAPDGDAAKLAARAGYVTRAMTCTITKPRQRLHQGEIGALTEETRGSGYPQVIAVPCSRSFLPTDHPVAMETFKNAGPQLTNTARLLFHKAEPGLVYPIKLTKSSALCVQQGVEYVLLAMPPCQALASVLPDDWSNSLQCTYETLIRVFLEQLVGKVTLPQVLPQKMDSKTEGNSTTAPPSLDKREEDHVESPHIPVYQHPGQPLQGGGWHGALIRYLDHTPELRHFIFYETSEWMAIYDGYPKAKVHLLLIPKPEFLTINSVTELSHDKHNKQISRLHSAARCIATKLEKDTNGLRLRMGYHSLPSLRPLHIHIVSQDFDSPALKTKRHWNSFTTPFFLDLLQVETALQIHGKVTVRHEDAEALLKLSLRCHACGAVQKTIPDLKQHVKGCESMNINSSESH